MELSSGTPGAFKTYEIPMSLTPKGEPNRQQLRLWPGVVAVVLQWLLWFAPPILAPEAAAIGFIGAIVCGLAVLVWWVFFSRVPHIERWGAVGLIVAAMTATPFILDRSIAKGMMGAMFFIYAIPVLSLALVVSATVGRRLTVGARRATIAAAILIACALFALLRTDGITGDGRAQLAWRWSKSSEQQLLVQTAAKPVTPPPSVMKDAPPEVPPATRTAATTAAAVPVPRVVAPARAVWPGFRGPHRDGVVTGARINTDWTSSPPVELWRRPVGPGWSSFAMNDGLLYTQEQRGDSEVVACYRAASGEPVWTHSDAARFWESNAGAGLPTASSGFFSRSPARELVLCWSI